MLSFRTFATLALLIAPVFGVPTKIQVQKVNGDKLEDSYIVKLKDGVNKKLTLAWLKSHLDAGSSITYDYESNVLNGFAGKFSAATIDALASNKDVEYISEDAIFSIQATQTNAPWGLQRIDQDGRLPSGSSAAALTYLYDHNNEGAGVDVYVLDTGIYTGHSQFEGRARWGYSAVGGTSDGHGHGTHCAGTIGSAQYGVAKKANLIAVKVLSDSGSGSTSGIVAGINWVINQYRASGRPSVISMSLGGGADTTLDNAVNSANSNGIFVAVAAGNSNVDAGSTSPARASGAFTVGASTIADARASFSNYGSVVDIFAPGQDVISTWIGSTTATNRISGTSMATPHVAGAAAYLLSVYGAQTPSALASMIKSLGVSGALTGLPSGTVNLLLNKD
ncbi:subtilisin-like serine protease [Tulasnella sp. 419]|nr:subtilisin-like serine protease [Tulasnella sp. 419]